MRRKKSKKPIRWKTIVLTTLGSLLPVMTADAICQTTYQLNEFDLADMQSIIIENDNKELAKLGASNSFLSLQFSATIGNYYQQERCYTFNNAAQNSCTSCITHEQRVTVLRGIVTNTQTANDCE